MVSNWDRCKEVETTPAPPYWNDGVFCRSGGETRSGERSFANCIPSCACGVPMSRDAQYLRRGRGGFKLDRLKKIETTPTPPYRNDGAIRRSGEETRCEKRDPLQTVSPPARAVSRARPKEGQGWFQLGSLQEEGNHPHPSL